MRRISSIFAVVAALTCAASGCASEGGPESTWSLEADPDTVVLDFEGTVDVASGTMTLRFLDDGALRGASEIAGARDPLTEVTVVKDGMTGSGPADTAELITVASGTRAAGSAECGTIPGGAPNCFFGDVDLRHFFATRHLSNAYSQITEITAGFEGYGGATSTTLGLDATRGLWRYGTLEPNAAGFTRFVTQRRWRFRQPTSTSFTFKGKVFATVQTAGGPNAPSIASLDEQGRKQAGDARVGCITDDGRFSVFSTSLPLVSTDTNSRSDVYRYDTTTGGLVLVSFRSTGAITTTGDATTPCLSSDGNIVVFASTATDMVPSDANAASDIFARDITAGTTTGVSTTTSGTIPAFCAPTSPTAAPLQGVGAFRPSISANGRFVAFDSTCARLCGQSTTAPSAANITAGCINGRAQVYRKDRTSGTTTSISVANGATGSSLMGGAGAAPPESADRNVSLRASISDDGNRVVFDSNTVNLASGDTPRIRDVFLRVVSANTTTRITTNCLEPLSPSISGDGTTVVFHSTCSQGIADTNASTDVFQFVPSGAIVGGLSTPGTMSILSVNSAGAQTGGSLSTVARVSSNGCRTVFRSNGAFDGTTVGEASYMRDRCTGTTRLMSRNGEGASAVGITSVTPLSPVVSISRNGEWTTFETTSSVLSIDGTTAFDTGNTDVYFVRN